MDPDQDLTGIGGWGGGGEGGLVCPTGFSSFCDFFLFFLPKNKGGGGTPGPLP